MLAPWVAPSAAGTMQQLHQARAVSSSASGQNEHGNMAEHAMLIVSSWGRGHEVQTDTPLSEH